MGLLPCPDVYYAVGSHSFLHAAIEATVTSESDSTPLDGVSLVSRQPTAIRRLPGYSNAKHNVPEVFDRRSQEFVARLGSGLIRDDLDRVFLQLRDGLGLKRRELLVTESADGFGTIETPFFLYTNSVFQSEDDLAMAVWQRDISRVVRPEVLLEDGCNRLFPNVFDTIEFIPSAAIDLEKLVDHIEALTDDRVSVDYDRQLTHCKVLISNSPLHIYVTPDAFRVIHPAPTMPRELVTCIEEIRQELVDFSDLT